MYLLQERKLFSKDRAFSVYMADIDIQKVCSYNSIHFQNHAER